MIISGGVAALVGLPLLFGDTHSYGTTFQSGLGLRRHRGRPAGPQQPGRASRSARCCSRSSSSRAACWRSTPASPTTSSRSPRACWCSAWSSPTRSSAATPRRRSSASVAEQLAPPRHGSGGLGMTIANDAAHPRARPPRREAGRRRVPVWAWLLVAFALISFARVITGSNELDSAGTLREAITATIPIALAGLGRPVVRARGRGQHRPRGHDDPRHDRRGLLRLLLRPLAGRRRRDGCSAPSAARCTRWPR